MKILLTGRDGQVGHELERRLAGRHEVLAFDRTALDLSRRDQIVERVRAARPGVILNAAAYTAVDKAESEPALAHAVNADAPGILAEEARRLGALLVHYSTDYVFDGTKRSPYLESDSTHPLSAYGRSKLAGEFAIRASGCRHLILRTAWVYASRGKNFFLTIRNKASQGGELRVVDDQLGAPTPAADIAGLTALCLARPEPPLGIFHACAAGETTWCGFAREIVRLCGLSAEVRAIPTSEYPTPATRPQYSVLDSTLLPRTTGMPAIGHWRDRLAALLSESVNL